MINIASQARWSDDLFQTVGRSWMREVEDRTNWRAIGEAYVQSSGLPLADDDADYILKMITVSVIKSLIDKMYLISQITTNIGFISKITYQ